MIFSPLEKEKDQILWTMKSWKKKDVIIGSRLAGTVISRKMVVAIGTGVAKANESSILREFSGGLEFTEGWAQNVLKYMDWVKRRGKTGKVESCPKFLEEEKLTFQRAISKFVSDHDITLELVLNLDQTPLFYISHGKYAFNLNYSKTIPIKGVDDKRLCIDISKRKLILMLLEL